MGWASNHWTFCVKDQNLTEHQLKPVKLHFGVTVNRIKYMPCLDWQLDFNLLDMVGCDMQDKIPQTQCQTWQIYKAKHWDVKYNKVHAELIVIHFCLRKCEWESGQWVRLTVGWGEGINAQTSFKLSNVYRTWSMSSKPQLWATWSFKPNKLTKTTILWNACKICWMSHADIWEQWWEK